MTRLVIYAAAAVAALTVLSACSAGGGEDKSTSPSGRRSPSVASTSTSPTPSTSPASTAVATPTGFGVAQPAVDTYLRLDAAANHAFADPQHSTADGMNAYLVGDAKTIFEAALFNEKRAGRYYKGTPASQRIRVLSTSLTTTPRRVVLRSCPLAAAVDPAREYLLSTRKPAPVEIRKVPPPYANTITVVQLNGKWLVSQFNTDASKTCTP